MRFVHTSTLSLLSVGILSTVAFGCASKDASSTFSTSGSTGSTGSGSGPGSGAGGGLSGSGSGSGTAGSGIVVTTSGSTGSGGSRVDRDANCGAERQGTKQIPIDIYIMQDKSGSMQCPAADDMCPDNNGGAVPTPLVHPTRWEATTMALNTFVGSMQAQASGIGIGIGFFAPTAGGNNAACNAATYATPIVPIAPLPGNAMPFTAAVGATMPNGSTPTTPALTGAIQYARAYTAMQMAGRTAAVVLVTDGLPAACGNAANTVQTAAAAAAAGFMGMPSIKTFVIGMGNTAALEEIAVAGVGGVRANCPLGAAAATCYIPTAGDVTGALSKALTAISGMVTCSYTIPTGSNPALVNVQVTIGQGGMPKQIGIVQNAAACTAAGGWYYDNPTTPTQIVLCPQSCDPIKATPDSGVEVLYGCPSQGPR
jgi:hypothetical protein